MGVSLTATVDVVKHGAKLTTKLELLFLRLATELSANCNGKCSNNPKKCYYLRMKYTHKPNKWR